VGDFTSTCLVASRMRAATKDRSTNG
jgi:hypothetical protein